MLRTDFKTDVMPEECYLELKTRTLKSLNLMTRSTIDVLITCQNFSTLSKLLRVTAQVMGAPRGFKDRKGSNTNHTPTITSEELAKAEMLCVTSAQKQ